MGNLGQGTENSFQLEAATHFEEDMYLGLEDFESIEICNWLGTSEFHALYIKPGKITISGSKALAIGCAGSMEMLIVLHYSIWMESMIQGALAPVWQHKSFTVPYYEAFLTTYSIVAHVHILSTTRKEMMTRTAARNL